MSGLRDYRNAHAGETVIVCGCGPSLAGFAEPGRFVTVGVNDVGRLFTPDYLVVLNPPEQFAEGRFRHVAESKARAVFTQLDAARLRLPHPNVVRFRLGRFGGTDVSAAAAPADTLPYTQNSPYVALCLAVYLGAARIGLIGVDFTDHHFFGQTGRHPLAGQFARIDAQYAALGKALAAQGVEVFNLSAQSRLTAFPKTTAEAFAAGQTLPTRESHAEKGNPVMLRVAVERRSPGMVGDFLEAIADSAQRLGHSITRIRPGLHPEFGPDTVCVVWNGRGHRSRGPTLYCEHGWLPRWDYQVSPKGINASSHLAPFRWDGKALSPRADAALEQRLEAIRRADAGPDYARTGRDAVTDLPERFLLAPLQMEHDTNLQRHVPPHLRTMQAFVDAVSALNPPMPVLFKQHPADARAGGRNAHLRLHLRRPEDRLRRHDAGNIHQILKSGRCAGIVTLNSNVIHDGLLWGVPGVVLGRNLWPAESAGGTAGPFLTAPPADWDDLARLSDDPVVLACRRAYLQYVTANQWTLADAREPGKVERLLRSVFLPSPTAPASRLRRAAVASPPALPVVAAAAALAPRVPGRRLTVNVVARNNGWLFEDLRQRFAALRLPDIAVVATETPLRDADAWLFLRAREADRAPDPRRTAVYLHDLADGGAYRPGGPRQGVARCAALVLSHPDQRAILEASGIRVSEKEVLERPLGAANGFAEARHPSAAPSTAGPFTVGWSGRPVVERGQERKRLDWLLDAARALAARTGTDDLRVLLIGERLEGARNELCSTGIDCDLHARRDTPLSAYPALYARMDCLVITAAPGAVAGPLSLFEALASGVPVIAARGAGVADRFVQPGVTGLLVDSVPELTEALARVRSERAAWFARREEIARSVAGLCLESWLEESVRLAASLATHGG